MDGTHTAGSGIGARCSLFSWIRSRFDVSAALCRSGCSSVGVVWQDENNRKPEMKLNVPEALKVLLVDDWEAITKNSQAGLYLSGCMHLSHYLRNHPSSLPV